MTPLGLLLLLVLGCNATTGPHSSYREPEQRNNFSSLPARLERVTFAEVMETLARRGLSGGHKLRVQPAPDSNPRATLVVAAGDQQMYCGVVDDASPRPGAEVRYNVVLTKRLTLRERALRVMADQAGAVSEQVLALIEAIHRIKRIDPYYCNPMDIVRAVNAAIRLSDTDLANGLATYLNICSDAPNCTDDPDWFLPERVLLVALLSYSEGDKGSPLSTLLADDGMDGAVAAGIGVGQRLLPVVLLGDIPHVVWSIRSDRNISYYRDVLEFCGKHVERRRSALAPRVSARAEAQMSGLLRDVVGPALSRSVADSGDELAAMCLAQQARALGLPERSIWAMRLAGSVEWLADLRDQIHQRVGARGLQWDEQYQRWIGQ